MNLVVTNVVESFYQRVSEIRPSAKAGFESCRRSPFVTSEVGDARVDSQRPEVRDSDLVRSFSSGTMNPQEALQRPIDRYRGMTGEERLEIAIGLHALAVDLAREGIRQQFFDADEREIDRRLPGRLEAART